jgi:hypothetical protein
MAKKPPSTPTVDSARKVAVAPVAAAKATGSEAVIPKKRTSPAKFPSGSAQDHLDLAQGNLDHHGDGVHHGRRRLCVLLYR